MQLFKNLKLKYQLSLLIMIALVMMMFIQGMYYVRFNQLTYKRAIALAENLMTQMAQNVDSTAASVEKSAMNLSYSKYIQELMVSDDPVRNMELYDFTMEIFNNTRSSNSNIYSAFLLNNHKRQISDPVHYGNEIINNLEALYHFKSSDFRKPLFSSIVKEKNEAFYYYAYIFPIFSYLYRSEDNSKIGSGLFILDTRELEKLVNINEITENSLLMILDSDNKVIVSSKGLKAGDYYQNVFWREGTSNVVTDVIPYEGKKSIVQYQKIESTNWKVISVIPMEELTSDMRPIVSFGIAVGVITMILLLIIGYGLIRNITRPVLSIVQFLSHVEERDLKQRVEVLSNNEVGIIADNINHMLNKVEAMTRKILENQTSLYEAKLAEQRAEFLALQSQINPHFLYNTLNCLSNIGIAYDVAEVADISTAMSHIFRYSIKGEDMVTLKEEVDCIKEYLLIMDIRYSGKFETTIDIADSLMELRTLKMVLQPIVENAMYHGLEQKNGKGRLLIQGFISENGSLQFKIEDDGRGMNETQLSELLSGISDYEHMGLYCNDKRSIGLGNINKRIKLQFGPQYGMDIISEEFVGTKVTLILPVIERVIMRKGYWKQLSDEDK